MVSGIMAGVACVVETAWCAAPWPVNELWAGLCDRRGLDCFLHVLESVLNW